MKKTFPIRLGLAILLILIIGMFSFAPARSQDKIKANTITISQPYSGGGAEDEFLVEPKTYIRLRVDILEIEPSETHTIASPSITTENGKPAEIIMGAQKESLSIRITPTIVEKKGVELKIEFQKEPEMKGKSSAEAFVQNGESAVIELFENKSRNSKISLKVTPLIEVVTPTKEYPGPVRELRLDDSYLIKNDDKLIAHGNLSATSDQGEISLWFTDDHGLFVLGFKRFEGAEPVGFVQGTTIKIKFGEVIYKWASRNPILPEGKWLVWVLHNPPGYKGLSIKNGQGILGKNGMIGIGTGKDAWKELMTGWKDLALLKL
ncbi:MAG: hypothetical protein ABSG19_08380 [Candidatus Aminicenantales bacterium]